MKKKTRSRFTKSIKKVIYDLNKTETERIGPICVNISPRLIYYNYQTSIFMESLIMRPSWTLTLFSDLGTHFLKLAGHIQLQYVNLALSLWIT